MTTLADLIPVSHIVCGIEDETSQNIVRSILNQLMAEKVINRGQLAAATHAIRERENLGTTAMGCGIAIPHAKISFSTEPILGFALVKNCKDWRSLDDEPVYLVFLVLTHKNYPEKHLAICQAIGSMRKNAYFLHELKACQTPMQINSLFKEYYNQDIFINKKKA